MQEKALAKCDAKTLKIVNFVFIGLLNLMALLRFFVGSGEVEVVENSEVEVEVEVDVGIGGTPTFLYIVQFLTTAFISFLLVIAEAEKLP